MRRSPLLFIGLVLLYFGLSVADVRNGFTLMSRWTVVTVAVVGVFLLAALLLRQRDWILALVLAGTLATSGIRLIGFEPVLERTVETWDVYQRGRRLQTAERVRTSFQRLADESRSLAKRLSRNPTIVAASATSAETESVEAAFVLLEEVSIPVAVDKSETRSRAVSGTTLYSSSGEPLAWAGNSLGTDVIANARLSSGRAEMFALRHGVLTYLVASEPLPSAAGFITVEIPLIAERRLDNEYLQDYDAVTGWAGRSVDTDLILRGEDASEMESLFSVRGESFWGGTDEAPRLYFSIRDELDNLHGVGSVAVEAVATSQLEAERRTKSAAAACLSLTAVAACLLFLLMGFRVPPFSLSRVVVAIGALWAARLITLWSRLPLSLGGDLDNPAHFASPLGWGLYRSPIDFLLTNLTVLLGAILLIAWARLRDAPPKTEEEATNPVDGISHLPLALRCAALLAFIVSALRVVQSAWANSNVALSGVQLVPWDWPRLAMQVGLGSLFLSFLAIVILLLDVPLSKPDAGRGVYLAAWSLVLWIGSLVVFASTGWATLLPYALSPLLAALVCARLLFTPTGTMGRGLHARFVVYAVVLGLALVSFYPALDGFEDHTVRRFIENTVAPAVVHHGESQDYVLSETTRTIDRMEREGRLSNRSQSDLAYEIWAASDLSVSAFSSSIEILDSERRPVSRFALNFDREERAAIAADDEIAPAEWTFEHEPLYEGADHHGILLARRSVKVDEGDLWEYQIRLAADWRNLPFTSTPDPYVSLFRTAGADHTLPFPPRELHLFVFDRQGRLFNEPREGPMKMPLERLQAIRPSTEAVGLWQTDRFENGLHRTYLFADDFFVYALSYADKGWLHWSAELVSWLLFAPLVLIVVVVVRLALGRARMPYGWSFDGLRDKTTRSFYGRLYLAFVILALVPIVSLAFLVRGVLVRQLERDIELEGRARAETVRRFVSDYVVFQSDFDNLRFHSVTDSFIEWIASLVDADVDVFDQGELIASSKRELYASGLRSTRTVASAHRALAVDAQPYAIHWESFGAFRYMVVSMPLALEPWRDPAVLSLPLATRKRETDRKFAFLNQSLLLAALALAIAAAALAQALARRIAEPVNSLTRATHKLADGDFDIALGEPPKDEIGALFESFTRMTEELKQQRDNLERTKKLEAWAEMARQVAHEIKNPLTPIQLSTEHLLRVHDDPNVDFEQVLNDCAETIFRQVATLRHISMEFSTFAKPTQLDLETADVEALVSTVAAPYQRSPPEGVTIELEIQSMPKVRLDPRLIQRTLVNLIENALHALAAGGTLRIEGGVSRRGLRKGIRLEVSDTGIGLDDELKRRVFEPYFSTRSAGSGLGLAIAKKVVDDHGGTIDLHSELGLGTRVEIWIPVSQEETSRSSTEPQNSPVLSQRILEPRDS